MKKSLWIVLLLALICTLALSACDDTNQPQTPNEDHVHAFSEWTTAKDATCTVKGEQERSCSCGEKETKSISATGHTYGEWITDAEPTCSENGTKVRYCSCGEKQTGFVVSLGHTPAETVTENYVNATCYSEGGYDTVIYCSICDTELERAKHTSTKLPHTPADAVEENVVDSTCYSIGSKDCVVYCSVLECHAELERTSVTIDKKDHTPADAVIENKVEATCTINGSYDEVVYCSVATCKSQISRDSNESPAFGHNYINNICTNCNNELASVGLEFISNGDGTCYVSGIGTCNDTEIIIPTTSPSGEVVIGIGNYAFACYDKINRLTIGNSIKTIGLNAFQSCKNLTSVIIGDSVTSIMNDAFWDCVRLVEVVNKSPYITVTNGDVGGYALDIFNYSDIFTKTNLYNDNGFIIYTKDDDYILIGYSGENSDLIIPSYVTRINPYCFAHTTNITRIFINDGVISIGENAFAHCNDLIYVEIGANVVSIDVPWEFHFCNKLTTIDVSESNMVYASIDGNLYSKDNKVLIRYAPGKSESRFIVPDGVITIGSHAFSYCNNLTQVFTGNDVTTLEDSAFRCCENLTELVIGDNVNRIETYAFSACNNLTSIDIDTSNWYISRWDTSYFHPNYIESEEVRVYFASDFILYLTDQYADCFWYKYTAQLL